MNFEVTQYQNTAISNATTFSLPISELFIILLLIFTLLSALALVYVKDLDRRLFIDYQDLQNKSQRLEVEHDRLILEKSSWITPTRVQQISERKLNMITPMTQNIYMLTNNGTSKH